MIKRTILALTAMAVSLFAQTSTFPAAVATDADIKVQVNGTQTTLTVALSAVATSTTVSNCTRIGPNMLATINTEIIAIANCLGTTLTFATTSPGCTNGRACDNSIAAAHVSGANVSLFADAWHHNALRVQVEAIQTALYSGASPTFANITASGNLTVAGNFSGLHAQNIGTSDFPTLNGTKYRQSAAISGFDWSISSSVTNLLDFRDTSSALRMRLDAAGVAGFGVYLLAPTVFAQATNSVSYAMKARGYPSGSADIFVAESNGGTNYLTVGSTGNLTGANIQNVGTGSSPTFANITASSAGGTAANFQTSTGIGMIAQTLAGVGDAIQAASYNGLILTGGTGKNTMMVLADSGGVCTLKGSTGLACVSDGRLKKDVRPVTSSLTKVLRLKPVEYNMKSDGQHAVGLIAQDVQKQFPQAVQETEDGQLTLSYQQLFPYLLKAVQEQQVEINRLKGRK